MSAARGVVLVPFLTHIEPACERGLRVLEEKGYEVRRAQASAAIDRTRSELATRALADGFDEIMWIDSDIAFDDDGVDRLRAHDAPVVAGLYAKRGQKDFAFIPEEGAESLRFGVGGGLLAVRYAATGFLLTRRRVYDDIARTFALPLCNASFGVPSIPYFLPMVISDPAKGYWYLGEDFSFCERARQAGHQVLADSTVRLGHVGKYTYGWEDVGASVPRSATVDFTLVRAPKK
jgi:hypothetical protein